MREILFRGKRVDNGEWVCGAYMPAYYSTRFGRVAAIFVNDDERHQTYRYPVDPATVGQYTGLTDKNGKKIWEGGILFDNHPNVQKSYSVIWFDGSFVRRTVDGHYLSLSVLNANEFEVIGNITDNPELLQN